MDNITHLVFSQVVGQVGDHDLGLGRDAVLGRTTLLLGATAAWLALGSLRASSLTLVGDISQRGVTFGAFLTILNLTAVSSCSQEHENEWDRHDIHDHGDDRHGPGRDHGHGSGHRRACGPPRPHRR